MTPKKLAIFVLSLPFLVLAIAWIPLGLAFCLIVSPIWGVMGLISMLRGQDGMWGIFVLIPLMMLDMYFELTGFCPRLHKRIEDL